MKLVPPLPPGWFRARLYHFTAPVIALGLVALLKEQTPLVDKLEYLTVNLRFIARAKFDPKPDPRLVFVGIDEASLHYLGKWPWPRYVEADFIKSIANAGVNPHTLTFDIMFSEDSNKLNQPKAGDKDDLDLADAVSHLASVITGALSVVPPDDPAARMEAERITLDELANPGQTAPLPNVYGDVSQIVGSSVATLPIKALRDQSLFGFVNDEPSPIDDIRHQIPLVIRVNQTVYPSLALQTVCQMLNVDPDKVQVNLIGRTISLKTSDGKSSVIPIDEHGNFTINYRREENFPSLSFYWLMKNLQNHVAPLNLPIPAQCDIQNKTLIIGESATALGDMGPTPLQGRSPLPYTHLNVINNILQNDYLHFVPLSWLVVLWLLTSWVTLLRLKDALLIEAVFVPIALMVVYIAVAFAIFWKWSIQIDLAWPILSYAGVNFGGVVLRWREEQQGREQVKQLFSRMLSPEIMNHLLDHPENVKMGGSERAVTILFSDIRDYTKFSEGLAAGEVVRQLNIYFERMVACVKESRGTFHKFIGDAVMAAWGDIEIASLGPEKDAQNAVRSALLMRRKLRGLNVERTADGLVPLRIGIGLNHGPAVLVGLIGASSRMEFTVMGDAVNTASRLEGLTKRFDTDLAVSESVSDLLGGEFLLRRVGLVLLVGKSTPTVVYEVLAEKTDPGESKFTPEMLARYEEAFDHFLARRFAEAEAGFLACRNAYSNDYCINEYLDASRAFLAAPPPPDWDGRIVMKTK